MLGLALGLVAGKLREMSDRVFRTSDKIEQVLQTNCIGVIPVLSSVAKPAVPISAKPDPIRDGPRTIARGNDIFWQVVDGPFSRFAESIRAIKVSADVGGAKNANKVLGLTSALPNEGKSTIAAALALIMAQGGSRVLLIDADLRNPSLTRRITPSASAGLLEVLAGTASLNDCLWKDSATGLQFLPAPVKGRIAHTHEIIGSPVTQEFFQKLRAHFAYIIVDMSPIAPVVDVRTAAHLVDSFIFVVEWGRTKIDVVEHALGDAPNVYQNLLGVALNKADLNVLSRYESYRGSYYYNKYYARYGYTD
jgi:succinoglycan biosynthesis transport protein ExoP